MVVNDIGVGVDGAANGDSPAERVVSEVRAAGGEAVAAEVSPLWMAVSAYGRVDVLVNNARASRGRTTSPTYG
ncbi:hypothetical protein [Actinophytocola algeriensis]|uniref:Uncharacterized protein n=1 Tax=Actinophytocola algeriensis TaxID=1768010 RepID=A0A7W7VHW1_9PSEU|nr:hypothetical protein [Actinophytocola algeriensis]MBB4910917.1 hypothetical protein [Actinophytocola algeriensis]MBE1473910.1 hypothetical protein [Actinophytocola algeriensis]